MNMKKLVFGEWNTKFRHESYIQFFFTHPFLFFVRFTLYQLFCQPQPILIAIFFIKSLCALDFDNLSSFQQLTTSKFEVRKYYYRIFSQYREILTRVSITDYESYFLRFKRRTFEILNIYWMLPRHEIIDNHPLRHVEEILCGRQTYVYGHIMAFVKAIH